MDLEHPARPGDVKRGLQPGGGAQEVNTGLPSPVWEDRIFLPERRVWGSGGAGVNLPFRPGGVGAGRPGGRDTLGTSLRTKAAGRMDEEVGAQQARWLIGPLLPVLCWNYVHGGWEDGSGKVLAA